jgi:hypothetical protein
LVVEAEKLEVLEKTIKNWWSFSFKVQVKHTSHSTGDCFVIVLTYQEQVKHTSQSTGDCLVIVLT